MSWASSTLRSQTKKDICALYVEHLVARGGLDVESPGFIEGIKQHFDSLPTRYALDVNVDNLDVLSHKRLLDEARADTSVVSFSIRPVAFIVQGRDEYDERGMSLPVPAFGSSPNLQADLGLNIREAHVFNTHDGFSLDVFVVDRAKDS
eukprot:gene4277-14388_t